MFNCMHAACLTLGLSDQSHPPRHPSVTIRVPLYRIHNLPVWLLKHRWFGIGTGHRPNGSASPGGVLYAATGALLRLPPHLNRLLPSGLTEITRQLHNVAKPSLWRSQKGAQKPMQLHARHQRAHVRSGRNTATTLNMIVSRVARRPG